MGVRESGERVGRAVVPTVWHSPLLSGASSHTSASCLQATKVSYGGAEQRRASELSCIFSCQSLGPEVPFLGALRTWAPARCPRTGFFPTPLHLFSLQQRDDVSESSVQLAESLVVTVCLSLGRGAGTGQSTVLFNRAQRTGIVAVHSKQRAGESLPP